METKKRTKVILILMAIAVILIFSININNNQVEEKQVFIKDAPIIIDLGSDCYTCTQQKGYLDKLKEKYVNSINIEKIDIYKNPLAAKKYKLKVIPTLIFINKDGKQVDRHEGLLTDIELETKLKDLDLLSTCLKEEEC